MKKKRMKKPSKGAVLVMLAAILIMAIVVSLWGLGRVYFEEPQDIGLVQQEARQDAGAQISCSSTNLGFKILSAEYVGRDIEVLLENQGSQTLDRIQVTLKGEEEEETLTIAQEIPGFALKTVHITPNPIIGSVRDISMMPVLTAGTVKVPCTNKERTKEVPPVPR